LGGIPIEILHGVGTCCGAVPASDAPVINLCDKAFFVFVSRIDWAHFGTRRVIAMHTGSGEKPCFDTGIFSLDIWNQFDPVDGTAFGRLLRADDPNIIFRMAGNDASLASRTFI